MGDVPDACGPARLHEGGDAWLLESLLSNMQSLITSTMRNISIFVQGLQRLS